MPLKAYFYAYSSSDSIRGPDYAYLTVTDEFVARLRRLSDIVSQHGLFTASIEVGPDAWMPDSQVKDLQLYGDEMVVEKGDFWFTAEVDHSDAKVKTRRIGLEGFFATIQEALDHGAGYVFFDLSEGRDLAKMVIAAEGLVLDTEEF